MVLLILPKVINRRRGDDFITKTCRRRTTIRSIASLPTTIRIVEVTIEIVIILLLRFERLSPLAPLRSKSVRSLHIRHFSLDALLPLPIAHLLGVRHALAPLCCEVCEAGAVEGEGGEGERRRGRGVFLYLFNASSFALANNGTIPSCRLPLQQRNSTALAGVNGREAALKEFAIVAPCGPKSDL